MTESLASDLSPAPSSTFYFDSLNSRFALRLSLRLHRLCRSPRSLHSTFPGQIRRFTDLRILKTKSIIYSAVTLIGAVWMYRFLNSGGWLTHHYQLNQFNDPDSLNLIPVIFEPIAVLGVVAYWVWRTRELYRLLFFLFLGQLMIGSSYLAVFLLFVLTYKPRMM